MRCVAVAPAAPGWLATIFPVPDAVGFAEGFVVGRGVGLARRCEAVGSWERGAMGSRRGQRAVAQPVRPPAFCRVEAEGG